MQADALRQFKSSRHTGFFRGSPKQAVCPFCFKIFYDKSTMNRHVSKRVCLGLQFQTADVMEDISCVPVLPVITSVHSSSLSNVAKERSQTSKNDNENQNMLEENTTKSERIPCPYCKKLMKGERGVRKHIDFYGCPMAVSAKTIESNDIE